MYCVFNLHNIIVFILLLSQLPFNLILRGISNAASPTNVVYFSKMNLGMQKIPQKLNSLRNVVTSVMSYIPLYSTSALLSSFLTCRLYNAFVMHSQHPPDFLMDEGAKICRKSSR